MRLFNQSIALFAAFFVLAGSQPLPAFTVIKNVNSGAPLTEKLVLFDKSHPNPAISLVSSDNGKASINADGAIQSDITGNTPVKMEIHWSAQGGLPETFDATAYDYLIITCRLEGIPELRTRDGKLHPVQRPDNFFFGPVLIDASGQNVGFANLADANDGKTPEQTVAVQIPMVVFTGNTGADAHHVKVIAFPWGKTHPDANRNFHLVIDKIALAN